MDQHLLQPLAAAHLGQTKYTMVQRPDAVPIMHCYAQPRRAMNMVEICSQTVASLPAAHRNVQAMRSTCESTFRAVPSSFHNALVEEEQERELEVEEEQEIQLQRPPTIEPAKPQIDPELVAAWDSGTVGKLMTCNELFATRLQLARGASLTKTLACMWDTRLRCSTGYVATVQQSSSAKRSVGQQLDEYLRPTCYIFVATDGLVLMSPHEAEAAVQQAVAAGQGTCSKLHGSVVMFAQRRPRCSFNLLRPELELRLGSGAAGATALQPMPLLVQLHLFSGSIMFESLEEQLLLCLLLGVCCTPHNQRERAAVEQRHIANDGFVPEVWREARVGAPLRCTVKESPLLHLRLFLQDVRRLGLQLQDSPMGILLRSARLYDVEAKHVLELGEDVAAEDGEFAERREALVASKWLTVRATTEEDKERGAGNE
jgi:hypothetical protein